MALQKVQIIAGQDTGIMAEYCRVFALTEFFTAIRESSLPLRLPVAGDCPATFEFQPYGYGHLDIAVDQPFNGRGLQHNGQHGGSEQHDPPKFVQVNRCCPQTQGSRKK